MTFEILLSIYISSKTITFLLDSFVKYFQILFLIISLITTILNYLHYKNINILSFFEIYLFFILFNLIIYYSKYINQITLIRIYNNLNLGEKKNNEIEDFVDRLLPKHVQENINSKDGELGESYENVTLLFADISGFTNYSAGKTPKEVVKMLSELFKDFDKVCNDMDLYKVCTIGDCYVVMGFLDKNNRKSIGEEAIDVIRMGLQFVEKIAEVRKKIKFDGLHMRIGIHTGDIIGGVIGTDVVRYDIYGPEVNVANKMESNGENDKVAVSEETMNHVLKTSQANNFEFTLHNTCKIESLKREITSYFVNEKDN